MPLARDPLDDVLPPADSLTIRQEAPAPLSDDTLPTPIARETSSGLGRPKGTRIRRWFDDLVDEMLLNPTATHKELGAKLHRHPAYISQVINSDLFRAYYAQRRREHTARVSDSIIATSQRIAATSLKKLETVLADDVHNKISPVALNEITKTALQTIGLMPQKGAAGPIVVQQNIHQNVVSKEDLLAVQQRINQRGSSLAMETTPGRLIEHSTQQAPAAGETAVESVASVSGEAQADPNRGGSEG